MKKICRIDNVKEITENKYKIEVKNWNKFDDIFEIIKITPDYL